MNLAIFAATGGIGRQVLGQATAAGHDVTAVVRDPRKLAGQVRVITADLATADQAALQPVLAQAVHGADAVISCLGPRSSAETGVARQGTVAIVRAMQAAQVRRIVVVSAAPIGTVPTARQPNPPRHDPGDGFVMRNLLTPLVKAALRERYADLAQMEEILRDSDLDWTVVRPPRLTDKALTGTYRTAYGRNIRRGLRISRADVAQLMLSVLGQPDAIRQTIGVAS